MPLFRPGSRPSTNSGRPERVEGRELTRGWLLFLYLLLVIVTSTAGKASRDAMFLGEFRAVQLPYADLAVSGLVGLVVSRYIRIGRHVTLPVLLAGSLLFFASNAVIFWVLTHFYPQPWLLPLVYIWVGVLGVLAPAQVWTLADSVVTTREAKRLFGFVSSGAIAGWILGGLLTTATVKWLNTEYLLLFMAAGLAISSGLVLWIWRTREHGSVAPAGSILSGEQPTGGLRQGLRLVWSTPYLRSIAIVIVLSSLATSIAGWQFKAIVQQAIPQKDALAEFFGMFNFYAGLAALAADFLITGLLLRRYGLEFALFVVPAALTAGSLGLLAWGSLAAAVLLRGSDQVLRYSIDKPTVELLYVPVPPDQTFRAKSIIDTVVWRAGDAIAAGTILLFATTFGFTAVQLGWVVLVLVGLWMLAAHDVRQRYVPHLSDSVTHHRHETERLSSGQQLRPLLERAGDDLASGSEEQILAALDEFAARRPGRSHTALHQLIRHSSPRVRQRAIAILNDARDVDVVEDVEKLLRDPDLAVRTEALLYLTHTASQDGHRAPFDPLQRIQELGDFEDFSVRSAMVAFLSGPGRQQNCEAARLILRKMAEEEGEAGKRARLEAARLLARVPDFFEEELGRLLWDPDQEVVSVAAKTAGTLQKRKFIPRLTETLGNPALSGPASEALAGFGDRIVAQLRESLLDPQVPMAIRREVPAVLLRIGTAEAEFVLLESLFIGDTVLRFNIIAALNKLRRQHPFRAFDTTLVQTVLSAEIRGHYRTHQLLAALSATGPQAEPLVDAMRKSMALELERIFRLLHLLYPTEDLHSAYVGIQSTDPAVHDNALEFLEHILSPKLRHSLVPLLDSAVSKSERLGRAEKLLLVDVPTFEEAIRALRQGQDEQLRSVSAALLEGGRLTASPGRRA